MISCELFSFYEFNSFWNNHFSMGQGRPRKRELSRRRRNIFVEFSCKLIFKGKKRDRTTNIFHFCFYSISGSIELSIWINFTIYYRINVVDILYVRSHVQFGAQLQISSRKKNVKSSYSILCERELWQRVSGIAGSSGECR